MLMPIGSRVIREPRLCSLLDVDRTDGAGVDDHRSDECFAHDLHLCRAGRKAALLAGVEDQSTIFRDRNPGSIDGYGGRREQAVGFHAARRAAG